MDLYYPPRPKSKLEEYNLKLKERELYTNNILDRFSENGNGAPLKDEKGNLITKRKAILENIKYINDNVNQSHKRNFNNNEESYDINNNNDINNYEENNEQIINNENYSLGNTLSQNQLNNNNSQLIYPNQIEPNNINYENNNKNPYNLINNPIVPDKKDISEKIKPNNIIRQNEETYEGVGIIPMVSDFKQIQKKMKLDSLQDDLARAIEEKRIREEKEKKKQLELDLKEDLKVRKAIEEEQRLLKIEKKKKEEEENRLMMINLQNIEKNKKKKKLIDIDEYYGKDFRLFLKNKNKNKIDKPNEEEETTDVKINKNKSDINNELEKNNIMNSMQDIMKTKLDTMKAVNDFTINIYKNRQIIEDDIRKLKKEVRGQYMEMNDLFQKLKNSSAEQEYTNNNLLQKSQFLKSQLMKSQIENTLIKNKINQNYDENMNINVEELESKNNPNLISYNSNLPGTSDFIYFNEENNQEYDLSSLAKAGKYIMELKGEGEMIPINEENKSNKEINDLNKNKFRYNDLNVTEYLRKKQFHEDTHKECKMEDLYKDLEDIESINKKLAPINKIHTLKNNFNVDYDRLLSKEKFIKEVYKSNFD